MTRNQGKHPPRPGSASDGNTGIFRLARSDLAALRQAADELKQAVFEVNLEKARNVPGFIRAMRTALEFPDWFGGNLDALHDCLTDLSWRPATGYIITLDRSEALRANPTSFAMFNEILASASDAWRSRGVPFRVFYLDDTPAAPSASQASPSP